MKVAWLGHVNHLNFGGYEPYISGTADRCQALSAYFTGEYHKLLMVVGQLLITHRRDLYSAARPSRRNGLITMWCDSEYLACAEPLRRAGLSAVVLMVVVVVSASADDRCPRNASNVFDDEWSSGQCGQHEQQLAAGRFYELFLQHPSPDRFDVLCRYDTDNGR